MKASLLDKIRIYADYHKIINCLADKEHNIDTEIKRLRVLGCHNTIEDLIPSLERCSKELRALKEDVRTEYNSLEAIIDLVNEHENKARNILHNNTVYEKIREICYEVMKKVSAAEIGKSHMSSKLLEWLDGFVKKSRRAMSKGVGRHIDDLGNLILKSPPEVLDFPVFSEFIPIAATIGMTSLGAEGTAYGKRHSAKNEWGSVEAGVIKAGYYGKSESSFLDLEAAAGAYAHLISVSGKAKAGDDQLGASLNVSGSVGNAELNGKAEFSIDEDGLNANVGGKAMVSAAEGKASGTISVFGVDITLSANGYAGALGVEGKAGIDDGKFVLKGGAAAGVGGSLGIEIGLNEEGKASLNELVNDFTDFAQDIGEDISNAIDDAKEAASDTLDSAKEIASDAINGAKKKATGVIKWISNL